MGKWKVENGKLKIENGNGKLKLEAKLKPLCNMIALADLDVYKLGERLSDMVWEDYDHWPEKAQRTIGYQIIRSSDSISINIAEGYGRYTPADRRNFYRYSRGSARRKLIDQLRMQEYQNVIDELGPKLNAFINSTNKRHEK